MCVLPWRVSPEAVYILNLARIIVCVPAARWMSGSNPQRVCVRHARRAFAAADGLFSTHKQCGSPAYRRACVLCAAAFVVSNELVGRAARRGPRNGNGAAEYQSPISIFGCKCMPRDFSGECGAGAVHDRFVIKACNSSTRKYAVILGLLIFLCGWHLGKD
jgi:cytochrome c5